MTRLAIILALLCGPVWGDAKDTARFKKAPGYEKPNRNLRIQRTPQCGPREEVVAFLRKKHNETPHLIGLTPRGHTVEVYVSEKGSWTIVATTARGVSCLTGNGTNLEFLSREPNG